MDGLVCNMLWDIGGLICHMVCDWAGYHLHDIQSGRLIYDAIGYTGGLACFMIWYMRGIDIIYGMLHRGAIDLLYDMPYGGLMC